MNISIVQNCLNKKNPFEYIVPPSIGVRTIKPRCEIIFGCMPPARTSIKISIYKNFQFNAYLSIIFFLNSPLVSLHIFYCNAMGVRKRMYRRSVPTQFGKFETGFSFYRILILMSYVEFIEHPFDKIIEFFGVSLFDVCKFLVPYF